MPTNTRRAQGRVRPVLQGLAATAALIAACGSNDPASSESPVVGSQDAAGALRAAQDSGSLEAASPQAGPSDAGAVDATDAAMREASAQSTADVDAATGPQTCGFQPCASGAPCPDLIVDQEDLQASIVIDTQTFAPTDCALVEQCVTTSGTRRLLRFDTGTANVGTAALVIGNPQTNACFQYSDCHMHYHFKGVGQYTLYQTDGVTVAAVGHKQGFCLEDVEQYEEDPGPMPATLFSCTDQGLHVGWEDIYPNDIDCQWIDITDVPAGNYILSVLIDGEHLLPESNYDNNEARVPVTVPPQ